MVRAVPARRAEVEARLHGEPVGLLGSDDAAWYRPLLERAAQQGVRPGCEGHVRVGGSGELEVELFLPAGEDSGAGRPEPSSECPRRRRRSGPVDPGAVGYRSGAGSGAALLIIGRGRVHGVRPVGPTGRAAGRARGRADRPPPRRRPRRSRRRWSRPRRPRRRPPRAAARPDLDLAAAADHQRRLRPELQRGLRADRQPRGVRRAGPQRAAGGARPVPGHRHRPLPAGSRRRRHRLRPGPTVADDPAAASRALRAVGLGHLHDDHNQASSDGLRRLIPAEPLGPVQSATECTRLQRVTTQGGGSARRGPRAPAAATRANCRGLRLVTRKYQANRGSSSSPVRRIPGCDTR